MGDFTNKEDEAKAALLSPPPGPPGAHVAMVDPYQYPTSRSPPNDGYAQQPAQLNSGPPFQPGPPAPAPATMTYGYQGQAYASAPPPPGVQYYPPQQQQQQHPPPQTIFKSHGAGLFAAPPPRPPRAPDRVDLRGPTPAMGDDDDTVKWEHVYGKRKDMLEFTDGYISVTHVGSDNRYHTTSTSLTRITHMTATTVTEVVMQDRNWGIYLWNWFSKGLNCFRSRAGVTLVTFLLLLMLVFTLLWSILQTAIRESMFSILPLVVLILALFTNVSLIMMARLYASARTALGFGIVCALTFGAFIACAHALHVAVNGVPVEGTDCNTAKWMNEQFTCADPVTAYPCQMTPITGYCDKNFLTSFRAFTALNLVALIALIAVHVLTRRDNLGPDDDNKKVPSDPRLVCITFHAHRGSGFPCSVVLPERYHNEVRTALKKRLWLLKNAHLLPEPAEHYIEERLISHTKYMVDRLTRATSYFVRGLVHPMRTTPVRSLVEDHFNQDPYDETRTKEIDRYVLDTAHIDGEPFTVLQHHHA